MLAFCNKTQNMLFTFKSRCFQVPAPVIKNEVPVYISKVQSKYTYPKYKCISDYFENKSTTDDDNYSEQLMTAATSTPPNKQHTGGTLPCSKYGDQNNRSNSKNSGLIIIKVLIGNFYKTDNWLIINCQNQQERMWLYFIKIKLIRTVLCYMSLLTNESFTQDRLQKNRKQNSFCKPSRTKQVKYSPLAHCN